MAPNKVRRYPRRGVQSICYFDHSPKFAEEQSKVPHLLLIVKQLQTGPESIVTVHCTLKNGLLCWKSLVDKDEHQIMRAFGRYPHTENCEADLREGRATIFWISWKSWTFGYFPTGARAGGASCGTGLCRFGLQCWSFTVNISRSKTTASADFVRLPWWRSSGHRGCWPT